MKSAYLLAGTRLGVLLKMILRHGVSLWPRFLLRLLFLLQGSFWSSVLAFRDRRIFKARALKAPVPKNPVFIVGHWRTGSTFLHQLMALDPMLAAPTLFQCCYPDSFFSSRAFVTPILGPFTKGRRPMDNVKMGIDEPQEDELAIVRLTGYSPLARLVFPHSGRYFLLDDETFLPPESARAEWDQAVVTFISRIHLQTGRLPVLKNPFHSMRIEPLRKLFPDALFIHIIRNPLLVIPSTIRMWSIVGQQNAMRKEWQPPSFDDVLTVFDSMLTRIRKDLSRLPRESYAEIRFEDFEKDPSAVLRTVYDNLGLDFSDTFEKRISNFLEENAGYTKNKYVLKKKEEDLILRRLSAHMARDGY